MTPPEFVVFPWLCSLDVLLFLSKTVSSAVSAASLDGKASRRHGHKTRVGRDYLPEQLGKCLKEVRYSNACSRCVPAADPRGNRSAVTDTMPRLEGTIFPAVVTVLMTTGQPQL